MALRPNKLVPLAYVADVSRSVAFYERLGFRVTNSFADEDERGLLWAALGRGQAVIMLSKATAPVRAGEQAVLFYLYFDDIGGAREALVSQGLAVGELRRRVYCPEGECRLEDPDGYVLMLAQS